MRGSVTRERGFASPHEAIPASGAGPCTLRAQMPTGSSPWRWALYTSVLFLMAGTIVAWTADTPAMRRIGIGIFVASAAVYAAARVATTFGGWPK